MVPKHVLSEEIANIRYILQKSYQKFYLMQLDAAYYYSGAKSHLYQTSKWLHDFITLKFPISSQRLLLKLYKLTTLPVPTSRYVITMKATQLLISLPKYFAIILHRDHFVNTLTLFKEIQFILCKVNFALTLTIDWLNI